MQIKRNGTVLGKTCELKSVEDVFNRIVLEQLNPVRGSLIANWNNISLEFLSKL